MSSEASVFHFQGRYLPLHLLKTECHWMLGGCGQMKLRNAITQRETLVCSQIILNKGWYSVSFLRDKRGRGNKYYVVPAAKTRHQWLCPPCLIHLSSWQEILDIVGGSYARILCFFFPSWHCGGKKCPATHNGLSTLVESPCLRLRQYQLELDYREERNILCSACLSLALPVDLGTIKPEASVLHERQAQLTQRPPCRHMSCSSTEEAYLQGQHFSVYRKEGSHGLGPGTKPRYIPTYTFSSFDVVVCHLKVRIQKFYHFFIDCVFGELLWKNGVK